MHITNYVNHPKRTRFGAVRFILNESIKCVGTRCYMTTGAYCKIVAEGVGFLACKGAGPWLQAGSLFVENEISNDSEFRLLSPTDQSEVKVLSLYQDSRKHHINQYYRICFQFELDSILRNLNFQVVANPSARPRFCTSIDAKPEQFILRAPFP